MILKHAMHGLWSWQYLELRSILLRAIVQLNYRVIWLNKLDKIFQFEYTRFHSELTYNEVNSIPTSGDCSSAQL